MVWPAGGLAPSALGPVVQIVPKPFSPKGFGVFRLRAWDFAHRAILPVPPNFVLKRNIAKHHAEVFRLERKFDLASDADKIIDALFVQVVVPPKTLNAEMLSPIAQHVMGYADAEPV